MTPVAIDEARAITLKELAKLPDRWTATLPDEKHSENS
jgi:hypothetical protein